MWETGISTLAKRSMHGLSKTTLELKLNERWLCGFGKYVLQFDARLIVGLLDGSKRAAI
jgi:hypothetical protein